MHSPLSASPLSPSRLSHPGPPHPPRACPWVLGPELTAAPTLAQMKGQIRRYLSHVCEQRNKGPRRRRHPPTNLGLNGRFNFLTLAERRGKNSAARARVWAVAAVGKRQLSYSWLIRCVWLCVASACYCCRATCERQPRGRGHSCSKAAALTSASFSSG